MIIQEVYYLRVHYQYWEFIWESFEYKIVMALLKLFGKICFPNQSLQLWVYVCVHMHIDMKQINIQII